MHPELKLYNNQIFRFCKSVFIKSELIALHMKNLAEKILGTELSSDYDNPYYINLTGEYSILDDPIYIIVDGKKVILSQQLLTLQPWLRKKYNIYGDSFEKLVREYPNRETFIRAIICRPFRTITDAVNAPDLALAYYDESILDVQEQNSLVEALKKYVYLFKERWLINEYNYEELYPLSVMTIFYSQLPLFLLTKRIDNLKTQFAHTMHIWDYLGSYGLEDYRSILTIEQQLFLYRNMEYIVQNTGKHGTLAILIEKLLNQNYLTIEPKMIINDYDYENIDNSLEITPYVVSRKFNDDPIATSFNNDANSIEQFLYILYNNGFITKVDYEKFEETEEKYSLINQTVLQTKYLELRRKYPNNPIEHFVMSMLLAGILHFSYKNKIKYDIPILVENYDYNESFSFRDGLLILIYCLQKQLGVSEPLIPSYVKIFPYICNLSPNDAIIPKLNKKISDYVNIREFSERYQKIHEDEFYYFPEDPITDILDTATLILEDVLIANDNGIELNCAMSKLHDQLFTYPTSDITNQEVPLFSLPNTKIKEYFNNHSVYNILNKLDNEETPNYESIVNQIINRVFPSSTITSYSSNLFYVDTSKYDKLKQLFIQLCSYSIVFIDPQIKNQSTYLHSSLLSTIDDMKKLIGIGDIKMVSYEPIPYDAKLTDLSTGKLKFSAIAKDVYDKLIEVKLEVSSSHLFDKDVHIFSSSDELFEKNLGILPNKLTPGLTYYARVSYRSLIFDANYSLPSEKLSFNVGMIKTPELNLPEVRLAKSFIKIRTPEIDVTDEYIEGNLQSSPFDLDLDDISYLERTDKILTPNLTIVTDNTQGTIRSTPLNISSTLDEDAQVITLSSEAFKLTYNHEDEHIASRWIIAKDEKLTNIIEDSGWVDKLKLFNITYKPNTYDNYFFAVQYKGKRFGVSNYSNVYAFNAKGIRRPKVLNVTGVYEIGKISKIKIECERLSTMGGISDDHDSTRYLICADYDLTKIMYDTGWIKDLTSHSTPYFKTSSITTYDIDPPKLEIVNEYLNNPTIEATEFDYNEQEENIKPESIFIAVQVKGKALGVSTLSSPYEFAKTIAKRGNVRVILEKEDI